MEVNDIIIHRYIIMIKIDDYDSSEIIATSDRLNVAKKMFRLEVKHREHEPITETHYKIILYDNDNDCELDSYDSESDIC